MHMKRSGCQWQDKAMPCPKCGRKPKIHTYSLHYALVECKPEFRKAHLSVFIGYHQPSKLMDEAVKKWNEAVDCANLPVW